MKWIKWIIPILLVVLIGGLLIVWANLNGIVRRTVQSQASSSLNLQTTVGAARVSIFGGSLALNDVQIASPEGFEAPRMFALDGARVGVRFGELRQDPVRINQIVVDQPRLIVEQRGGNFNFKVLMDLPSDETDEPLRLIINEMQVNDAQVVLRPGIPGLAQEIQLPIPSFALSNIGTGEGAQNGAAVKEVVMLVVTTMAAKASESDKLPPEVQMLLKGDIEAVARDMAARYGGQALEELKKNIPPEIGDVLGGVLDATGKGEDPGKAVEEGLRGLIDRRQRKDEPATQPR